MRDHRRQPAERREPLALRRLALEARDRVGERVEGARQQPRVLVVPRLRRARRGGVRSPVAAISFIASVSAASGRVTVRATAQLSSRLTATARAAASASAVRSVRSGRSASARERRTSTTGARGSGPERGAHRGVLLAGSLHALHARRRRRPEVRRRLARQRRREHAAARARPPRRCR